MSSWKRVAFASFAMGVAMALIFVTLAKAALPGHPKLWVRVIDLSVALFPTQFYFAPLSGGESFPHDLVFYLAAIVGNGITYSLVGQVIAGLYWIAKRLLSHL